MREGMSGFKQKMGAILMSVGTFLKPFAVKRTGLSKNGLKKKLKLSNFTNL